MTAYQLAGAGHIVYAIHDVHRRPRAQEQSFNLGSNSWELLLVDENAVRNEVSTMGDGAAVLLVLNAHYEVVDFMLPACPGGTMWVRLLDTASDQSDYHGKAQEKYPLNSRSFALFASTQ